MKKNKFTQNFFTMCFKGEAVPVIWIISFTICSFISLKYLYGSSALEVIGAIVICILSYPIIIMSSYLLIIILSIIASIIKNGYDLLEKRD